jgi:hypothetical protein
MDGCFRWLPTSYFGKRNAGEVAGWPDDEGYWHIRVDGHLYLRHRLAWLYVNGEWPPSDLDHRNGKPGDDLIDNLRPASSSQNTANSKLSKANKSGLKGVCWSSEKARWRASVVKARKQHHLGYFDTPEAAHAAYVEAARRLHGEFARAE